MQQRHQSQIMGTISDCLHLKIYLYVNSTFQRCPSIPFAHWCRWIRWCTLSCEYLREFSKKVETVLIPFFYHFKQIKKADRKLYSPSHPANASIPILILSQVFLMRTWYYSIWLFILQTVLLLWKAGREWDMAGCEHHLAATESTSTSSSISGISYVAMKNWLIASTI